MVQTKDIDWLNEYKKTIYICYLQETHFSSRNTYKVKVRGLKKLFQANRDQQKAGIAIPISDKIDLEIKNIIRDKEGNYIITKDQSKKIQQLQISMHPT